MSKKRRHPRWTVLLSSVWVYSECGQHGAKPRGASQTTVRQKTLLPVTPGPSRFPKRLPWWDTEASQGTGSSLIHPHWWMTQGQRDNTNHGNNSRSPQANSIFTGIRQTSSFLKWHLSKRRKKKKREEKRISATTKKSCGLYLLCISKKVLFCFRRCWQRHDL